MISVLRFFNWYIPIEFNKILQGVKDNKLKYLCINSELLSKFGDLIYQQKNCPYYFELLAKSLIKNTSVVFFSLKGSNFPKGTDYLIDALKNNQYIKTLILDIELSTKELENLPNILRSNVSLKRLRFHIKDNSSEEYFLDIVEALKENQTLEILELTGVHRLTKKCVESLSTLPKFNHTLQKLRVSEYFSRQNARKEIFFPARQIIEKIAKTDKNNYLNRLPHEILQIILDTACINNDESKFKKETLSIYESENRSLGCSLI